MTRNITASFVKNEYSEHYKKILFKIEESQFMETIPFIEEKKRKEIAVNKCFDEIKKNNDEINILKDLITAFENKKRQLYKKIHNIQNGVNAEITERKIFIAKCPFGDCIGYLSTQHKCDLCNNWFCAECNELKGLDRNGVHICNPDTVETVKLMKRECKNCPNCTSIIYKIDGCDLMWCVSCHTAFSWTTLKINNNENIHNPHYFEWLRTQNTGGVIQRNPNDIICGREINNVFFDVFINTFKRKYDLIDKIIVDYRKQIPQRDRTVYNNYPLTIKESIVNCIIFSDILRSINHIRVVDIDGRFRNNIDPNDVNQQRELRMRFLEKEIDEITFKSELEKRNKSFEKKNEIRTLLRMYITCMIDIIYLIYEELNKSNADIDLNVHFQQIHNLIDYVNEQFVIIGRTFNCTKYRIDPENEWKLT